MERLSRRLGPPGEDGVEFRVLGPMEVAQGERLIEIGSRMSRALLAVLLVDAGRVVSVDRLVDALWGESPPATATTALRGYVAALRRALEPSTAGRLLITQSPGYLLAVDPPSVDAGRFEAAAAHGRSLLAGGDPRAAGDVLRAGLALWRGAPYADLASEPFLHPEIARLEELRQPAEEDLMETSLAVGDHAAAVPLLERLVAAEPLRERRWQLLMLALYRSGRQADALRAFAQARTTLAEELGLDPGPALRQLEEDILRHAPVLDWPGPTPREHTRGHLADRRPVAEEGRRLVGREAELARLEACLYDATAGRGRVAVLSGEAGIGKTRLAEALAARTVEQGVTVAWGRCVEGEAPALWPWSQVVRTLAHGAGPERAAAALAPQGPLVAQVVPELKELVGTSGAPSTVDLETTRLRLYDAITSFLVRLAGHGPVVVVIEDLQWADLPSVRLLQFLAANVASARLLVVVTHRTTSLPLDHPLGVALGALARERAVTRLSLAGLAPEQVALLIAGTSDEGADPALVAELHRRTNGNPFFLVELLRLLSSEHPGGADAGSASLTAVPASVRDVLRHRLSRLSGRVPALLTVAAVVGRDFDLEVVARASGSTEDDAVDLLEEALEDALVVEAHERDGGLRFSHDLVRETLYNQLSGGRKARLHRRVGEAFESLGRTDGAHLAPLAEHFWLGLPAGAADKAFTYAVRAARQDISRLAYERAEQHLRRATSLLDRLPPDGQAARRELSVQEPLSLVLLVTRGYASPEVGGVVARASELCRQLGDAEGLLLATWRLLSFHILRAEYAATADLATSLLVHPEATHNRTFPATAHRALGAVAFSRGELADARRHLQEAVPLADAAETSLPVAGFEVRPAAFARDFLALTLWLLGETERATEVMAEALDMADPEDEPFTLSFSLTFAASLAVLEGDAPRVRERARASLAMAERHGYGLLRPIGAALAAWADVELGDEEAGTKRLKRALQEAAEAGAQQWRHFFLALLAAALRRRRARAALTVLDRALSHSVDTGERFYEPEIHRVRGEILLASADAAAAEAAFGRAVAVARSQGSVAFQRRAQECLARLHQAQG